MSVHRREPPQRVSQDALLCGQVERLPGEVEKVIAEVLVDEHLLVGDGVLNSSQVGAVRELGLKCESIVILRLKETLQDESLLVIGSVSWSATTHILYTNLEINILGQIDMTILPVLKDLLDDVFTTRAAMESGTKVVDRLVGVGGCCESALRRARGGLESHLSLGNAWSANRASISRG